MDDDTNHFGGKVSLPGMKLSAEVGFVDLSSFSL